VNDYLFRRGPVRTLAVIGGVLVIAGILLAVVPFDHGTVSQWNGLCTSGLGQLGQLLDASARQDCGVVGLADHLLGWLWGGGILALAAAGALMVKQHRPGTALSALPVPPGPSWDTPSRSHTAPPGGPGDAAATAAMSLAPASLLRLRGRRLAVIGTVAALLAAGGAWAAVSAAASPQLLSFLCWNGPGDTSATLLQWQSGSVVSGTYRNASLGDTAPDEQVSTNSGALTGTVSGSSASLDLGGSGQMYGTLGSNLVLNVPQQDGTIQPVTCKPGTAAGWNQALTVLGRQVTSDNAAAAAQQQEQNTNAQITQADQQLTSDITTLTQDATALNTDTTLADDIQQMQTDVATEQSDYQTELTDSCLDKGGDADTVGGDADAVGGDLDGLNGDISGLQASDVSSDLSAVQSDVATISNLGSVPNPDPSAAIKVGKKALKNLVAAIAWATSKGNSLNSQAQQISNQAQSAANC
jgi:hypothetical protein